MAVDQKRRQKRLMKKRRKDKDRKKSARDLSSILEFSEKRAVINSGELPIHRCLLNKAWQDSGLASLLLSRRQDNGLLVCAVYLVDILCLGVKNAFCCAGMSEFEYRRKLVPGVGAHPVDCSLSLAHGIVYGGIDYAAGFGFRPHKDFELARHVLGDRGGVEPCEAIEFGKDGKPCYVSGPRDNVEHILWRLKSTVGEGNFDFAIQAPGGGSAQDADSFY